jgi:hypothetical protein
MARDAADKAHDTKVDETADGERLVEHSTFTAGDRELRAVADSAEAARMDAYRTAGHVAAPGVGDYHAVRREAKHAAAGLVVVAGEGTVDDPSALAMQAGVGDAMEAAGKAASAAARRAASQNKGAAPAGRRTRSDVMGTGNTGGLQQGTGEGGGKSASSSGTDTTDRGMDASVGDQPANPQLEGIDPAGQDRPSDQAQTSAGSTRPASGRGGRAK